MDRDEIIERLDDETGAVGSRVNWATVVAAVVVVLLLLWLL